jgi:hypothetical protein
MIALAMPPAICAVGFATIIMNGSSRHDVDFNRERCSWYCHDHNCHHNARLPDRLTADDGAFGMTINALAEAGRSTGLGYQGMNVLVFCVIWPTITYFFYTIAVTRAVWNLL